MQEHWYKESLALHDEMLETFHHDVWNGFVIYARSAEAKALNELNQDAFVIQTDDTQLVAVVADGVGQSFRGDIAATAVAQSILLSLWDAVYAESTSSYTQAITQRLTMLAERVTHVLHEIDLSYHASLFREALEQRRKLGSESMFVAMKADITDDQLYVCWLGDCRIRLQLKNGHEVTWQAGDFDTMQRWSSTRLLVGDIHTAVFRLSHIQKILMYSDGLQLMDDVPLTDISTHEHVRSFLQRTQQLPESDDVTCILIHV